MSLPVSVALADDHLLMRKGLCLLINEHHDLQVIADAGDGKALLDMLEVGSNNLPDVCILDVKMPVLNGYDTLAEIKKRWPLMKVLILSMYDNELSILKLLRSGADGYCVKGEDPTEFCNAIIHVYNGGIYYPSGLLQQLSLNMSKDDVPHRLLQVTAREYTFLSYCSTELTYKEIAARMNVSVRTAEGYRD